MIPVIIKLISGEQLAGYYQPNNKLYGSLAVPIFDYAGQLIATRQSLVFMQALALITEVDDATVRQMNLMPAGVQQAAPQPQQVVWQQPQQQVVYQQPAQPQVHYNPHPAAPPRMANPQSNGVPIVSASGPIQMDPVLRSMIPTPMDDKLGIPFYRNENLTESEGPM